MIHYGDSTPYRATRLDEVACDNLTTPVLSVIAENLDVTGEKNNLASHVDPTVLRTS